MRKNSDDLPLFAREARRFFTISELNQIIKGTLEEELEGLWVVGEISNFRAAPSGHYHFTLKDDKSQISTVMFRRQGSRSLLRSRKWYGGAVLWQSQPLPGSRGFAAVC